jgi:hypothetical protein
MWFRSWCGWHTDSVPQHEHVIYILTLRSAAQTFSGSATSRTDRSPSRITIVLWVIW